MGVPALAHSRSGSNSGRGFARAGFARVLQCALGLVFVVAALSKAMDPRSAIDASALVFGVDRHVAFRLVGVASMGELVLGVGLLFGLLARFLLCLSLAALLCFTAFLAALARLGAPVGCGCVASVKGLSPLAEVYVGIARNFVLVVVALIALFFASHARKTGWNRPSPTQ